MLRGQRALGEYGWPEVERDLAAGLHPEVVSARLGEPIDYLLSVADEQRWPITWHGPTPDEIVNAFKWTDA